MHKLHKFQNGKMYCKNHYTLIEHILSLIGESPDQKDSETSFGDQKDLGTSDPDSLGNSKNVGVLLKPRTDLDPMGIGKLSSYIKDRKLSSSQPSFPSFPSSDTRTSRESLKFGILENEDLRLKTGLSSSTGAIPDVPSLLADSPGMSRKECGAKGCSEVKVRHVYQGYFCSFHESTIAIYRSIIEQKKKDPRELHAREAEQNMRKVPHPLYQKDIDNLKANLRKIEMEIINRMFATPGK